MSDSKQVQSPAAPDHSGKDQAAQIPAETAPTPDVAPDAVPEHVPPAASEAAAAATPAPAPAPAAPAAPAPPPIDEAEMALRVEAVLMTTDRPLASSKISEILGKTGVKPVVEAIKSLNRVYDSSGRSFKIEEIAGGWQILTLPRFKDVLNALHRTREQARLTPAALETLAIVAYKQPTTRADIEAIRGAASGEVLRGLMERHLVRVVGRAEIIGRPMLYGTTKTFLEVFGLGSLKDLPKVEELKQK